MVENPQSSVSNSLEQEIAQIEQDLASKRAALEQQQQSGQITEVPPAKETLREVIRERISAPQPVIPPVVSGQPPEIPSTSSGQAIIHPPVVELPAYLSPELKEKVQELVNIAFSQTLETAIKQAQATNNAALTDAFHDALVDELYIYLIERKKIQKL